MTSPVDTTVKFIHSDMAGAPVLTGAQGSLISLLDAWVNGFGIKTLTSLTVSDGVATCAFSGTSPAMVDSVVLIAGNSNANLNGEQKVTATGTGTVSFATAESDMTTSGTTTMKMAPSGWEKRFSGTNLAVYRSLDVSSTRFNLRVSDVVGTARVVGYETMTAVSTGTQLFPTSAQQSGGLYWKKAYTGDVTTPISWMIFSNGKRFSLWAAPFAVASYSVTYNALASYSFGDFTPLKASVDSYPCLIGGGYHADAFCAVVAQCSWPSGSGLFFARSHTGATGAVAGETVASFFNNSGTASGENALYGELPGITGKLMLTQPMLANGMAAFGPRGITKEVYHTPQVWWSNLKRHNDRFFRT
jgi:hypothetical protein